MIDGLTSIAPSTGIVQNTTTVLQAVLAASTTAETEFQKTSAPKTTAIADSNASAFISTAKRVLILHLGPSWSTAWAEVGFVNGSIAPRAPSANASSSSPPSAITLPTVPTTCLALDDS